MIPLSKPTKVIEIKDNVGVFEIDALYPGYGVTVGNSLRRVLLSSLEGAAVTSVKIKGVSHEFSTLPGVTEDVITILLNLKQMRFRVFSDEPQKATLKLKGEKKAKGSDFDFSSQVELQNQNILIATLTDKNAELQIEIQIEKGIGYVPSEERKRGKEDIGTISLDSIFTPVQRVSFKVQNMRVGEHTNYNRVILEIETDGTMTPEQALEKAAGILIEQFSIVRQGVEGMEPPKKKVETRKKAAAKKKPAAKKAAVKKPAVKKAAAKKVEK